MANCNRKKGVLPQPSKETQGQQSQNPVKGSGKVFVPKKLEKQSNKDKVPENLENDNQGDLNRKTLEDSVMHKDQNSNDVDDTIGMPHIDIVPDWGNKDFEIPRDEIDPILAVDGNEVQDVHCIHPEQPNDDDNDSIETVHDESQPNLNENSDYSDMPSLVDDSQKVIVLDSLDGNAASSAPSPPSVNKQDTQAGNNNENVIRDLKIVADYRVIMMMMEN